MRNDRKPQKPILQRTEKLAPQVIGELRLPWMGCRNACPALNWNQNQKEELPYQHWQKKKKTLTTRSKSETTPGRSGKSETNGFVGQNLRTIPECFRSFPNDSWQVRNAHLKLAERGDAREIGSPCNKGTRTGQAMERQTLILGPAKEARKGRGAPPLVPGEKHPTWSFRLRTNGREPRGE